MANTPTNPPLPAFDTMIRARLNALMARKRWRISPLATDMGHKPAYLLRKLKRPHSEPRPLTLADIQRILDHIGESSDALFSPVLLRGDQQILAWIDGQEAPTQAVVVGLFERGRQVLERLTRQGLIFVGEGGALTLSALGRGELPGPDPADSPAGSST